MSISFNSIFNDDVIKWKYFQLKDLQIYNFVSRFTGIWIYSWRHQMKTFSALLATYAGNSPVAGEFPAQRPVTRSVDVLFGLRLNKRLSEQSRGWWYETLSRPLWRHCNVRLDGSNGDSLTHFEILHRIWQFVQSVKTIEQTIFRDIWVWFVFQLNIAYTKGKAFIAGIMIVINIITRGSKWITSGCCISKWPVIFREISRHLKCQQYIQPFSS